MSNNKRCIHLLFTIISCGSSARCLAWTQDVDHLLLHLLEDFLELGILQHQGLLTRLVVTEHGLVHLTFVAAEINLWWNILQIYRQVSMWLSSYLAVAFAVFQRLLFPSDRPRQFTTSIASRERWKATSFSSPNPRIRSNWRNFWWRSSYLPSFLSFLSTSSWLRRSLSFAASLSFLLASWLYWEARLAIILWSLRTWWWLKNAFCRLVRSLLTCKNRKKKTCRSYELNHTSSFSVFKQLCKVLILSCSCLSISCRPDFSLMDSSNWSWRDWHDSRYEHNKKTVSWKCNLFRVKASREENV